VRRKPWHISTSAFLKEENRKPRLVARVLPKFGPPFTTGAVGGGSSASATAILRFVSPQRQTTRKNAQWRRNHHRQNYQLFDSDESLDYFKFRSRIARGGMSCDRRVILRRFRFAGEQRMHVRDSRAMISSSIVISYRYRLPMLPFIAARFFLFFCQSIRNHRGNILSYAILSLTKKLWFKRQDLKSLSWVLEAS